MAAGRFDYIGLTQNADAVKIALFYRAVIKTRARCRGVLRALNKAYLTIRHFATYRRPLHTTVTNDIADDAFSDVECYY